MKISQYDFAWANYSLPWRFEQELPDGRMLGANNRIRPIDYRIEAAIAAGVDFQGKTVLEPGCCEGHITVGLCRCGADVTAFDARMANYLKTLCRCASWEYYPKVFLATVDQPPAAAQAAYFDILFHSGLLYHLPEPVAHFRRYSENSGLIILDTHTAKPEEPTEEHEGFLGHWWKELGGPEDMLAGLQERSFWLTKESLAKLFSECGFEYQVLRDGKEHFGPRTLYLLKRIAK